MVVGNNVASRIHDEAGAERLAYLVTLIAATRTLAAEEPIKEILKVLVRALTALVICSTARGASSIAF